MLISIFKMCALKQIGLKAFVNILVKLALAACSFHAVASINMCLYGSTPTMSNAPVENRRPAVILCTEIKGNFTVCSKSWRQKESLLCICVCECECVKDESQREPIVNLI